ncbi:uncharacterized protein [Physcomitrium patens]|nr:golgin subfamily A member 4-like isoform X3 [Physcomitrium patens]|eukprot:XP_024373191.1 golgin subfamily A member 4-like isoform X3 [Physcomitrella patens]
MAAAYLPSPCSLRSTWSGNHRISRRGVGVPGIEPPQYALQRRNRLQANEGPESAAGAEVRWGIDSTLPLKKLGCFSRPSRTHFSFKKAGRWRRTGTVRARFDFRGNSSEQTREEDASILMEMTTLVDELLKLKEVVNETNKGVGADVRNRVDVLYNRATLLKYSAENTIANGGRVPVQLTATLKGLQREHASVENIVRLAMKAGPVITDVEAPPSSIDSFLKEAVKVTKLEASGNDTQISAIVLKEKEDGNASVFESLTLESSLKTVEQPATFGTEGYVMSAPAANNSSLLAVFREEIERRVIEQLARKTKLTEPERDDGYLTSEGLRLFQNLPLSGRMSTKRERKAEKHEAQAADTSSTELDAPEARPFFLQESQELNSLADEQQQSTAVEAATNSKGREKLLRNLATLEQLLSAAQEDPARAEKAEAQLQHLTEEIVATVPLDVHEQVVRLERESLVVARTKLAQVTTELREKEAMLVALKQEMITEQKSLRDKVRELSNELSERITPEEVEVAVNNAVHELETELRKTLKRAESMKLELEANENLLKQLQQEWNAERASLCKELANVKRKLTELQMEHAEDRARFIEAADKVNELEDSVIRLQNSMMEAEEVRKHRDRSVLATVKSLVADMLKTKRAQTKSRALNFRLSEASKSLDVNDKCEVEDPEAQQLNYAEDVLGSMFSGEKATALEAFFIMMGVLIQQENEKMTTTNLLSREISNGAAFGGSTDGILEHDLSNLRSSKVDVKMIKPTITLYYESSWEFAHLHYSADNSAWTELPGVCMRNEVLVNNVPVKVIDVEGNSIEFVLTDGKGSWDCAPSKENYHIRSSGTFFLSSGLIEQRT